MNNDVLFIGFQQKNNADGGLNSMSYIIDYLKDSYNVILISNGDKLAHLSRWGITTKSARFDLQGGNRIFSFFKFNWLLFKTLKYKGLVHVNDIDALVYSIFLLKLFRCKVIFSIRGVKKVDEGYGLKWKVVGLVKKILVLSSEMKSELQKRLPVKLGDEKIDFIYSPVLQQKNSISEVLPDRINIGLFATFRKLKNQLNVIEKLIPYLKEKRLNFHFHFVGDFDPQSDKYASKCQQAINELGIQDIITLHGYQKDVHSLYQQMNMVVVPSDREGLSRSMIEAISHGVPVISFEVSSAKEILENHNCGIVVSNGDYEQMGRAILNLTKNESLYSQLALNARQTSLDIFDPNKLKKQYLEFYEAQSS